jgi:hypothetical protein
VKQPIGLHHGWNKDTFGWQLHTMWQTDIYTDQSIGQVTHSHNLIISSKNSPQLDNIIDFLFDTIS